MGGCCKGEGPRSLLLAGRERQVEMRRSPASPSPRRAPRGGSLLGLLLPAPLGVEPRRCALCGARSGPRWKMRPRPWSVRAAQQHAIRAKRGQASSRVLKRKLNWLQPYRRAVGTTAARCTAVFRCRTRQTLPATRLEHRRIAPLQPNARSRGRAHEYARLGPARARDEGAPGRDHGV